MNNVMTFRDYVRKEVPYTPPAYSFQSAYCFTVMSILMDPTFPEDESDGLRIKDYIRRQQIEYKSYSGDNKTRMDYDSAVLRHFETLWNGYKDYIKKHPTLPEK